MFELGSAGGGGCGVGWGERNSDTPMFYNRLQNSISYTAFKIFLWKEYLPELRDLNTMASCSDIWM